MQKQLENDGHEQDDLIDTGPIDMQYIGNKTITTALKNLKAELNLVRSDATHVISGGQGIEETVEAIGQLFSEALLLTWLQISQKANQIFEGFLP